MIRFRPLTQFLLALVCCAVALAQTKRPMTFEDVVALNRASDAQISPDGRRIAFVVTAWDREADRFNADLWLVASDGSGPAFRLTFHPKRDDHPRWSPDSRRLAFLSDRTGAAATASTDSPGMQIFLLNAQGGEAWQLTSHQTAVQGFEWSPDGRRIAFIAAEPRPQNQAKDKPQTKPPVVVDEDYRYAQLWIVDAETKEVKQLTRGARHITGLSWSPDGAQIVFTARATPRLADNPTTEVFSIPCDLKSAPLEAASARQLTRSAGAEAQPQFSPDGRWISYLAHADGDPVAGPDRIHLLPAAGGGARVLARDFNGYIRSYRWASDSQRLLFSAGLGVNEHIYSIELMDRGPQALTRGEGINVNFSAISNGTQIAYVHEDPQSASEVMALSARNPIPIQLTRLNPQVESFALGGVEAIKWKSQDGTEIEGLLFYPVGFQSTQRYPLLTYIHGGPEGAYVKSFNATVSAFPQLYAARGYAVFLPNFRGSSNYGARFAQANAREIGKVDYEDIMSGIDELIKRGIADENRLAVAGWSYGGYMSGWIIGHTNRFKCAAYGAGLSNAVSYWATADIQYSRERLHGGTPWENRRGYDELSPLTHLRQARTPTLIFHGEKDERVPLAQSLETYRTLQRLGVPVQLVIYPEQGHGLQVPSYQLDKMQREFAWIEKYVMKRELFSKGR
jgi:dipeptidyl aminopeptidase/acylaminoacyl peptidase